MSDIKFSDSSYDALIRDIFRRFPSFGAVGASAYKPGLEHMKAMCALMDNPERKFRSIHVAGTNGKGSTCNMLAAHFASQGLRVGLYTSPHILDFRERIRLVERPVYVGEGCLKAAVTLVSKHQVWDFMQRFGADIDRLDLSLFEITTAMAFHFFAASGVDIAIVETGLGGRLDATNVITPLLSVITNIGYDHMDILGHTIGEIAAEKAGIIKAGVPVVIGERGGESDPVFLSHAASAGSSITFAQDLTAAPDIATADEIMAEMDLRGEYQSRNLTTVLCALRTLGQQPDINAICHAGAICDFHGRWEKISDNPLTIIDIGHNAHGLKYNFNQLNSMLDDGTCSDLVMVYGSVADKDVDAVLRMLPPRARVYFTAADNRRAMPATDLFSRSARSADDSVVTSSVAEAVSLAVEYCSHLVRPLLYIGGSTYIVSEAVHCCEAVGHSRFA